MTISNLAVQHNSIILVLEPGDSIRLADLLVNTNLTSAMLALGNSATWSCKDNIKVHYSVNHDYNESAYFRKFQSRDRI